MSPTRSSRAANTTQAVDDFMAALEHPHKAEVQALRDLILGSGTDVAEGIKWNAPSYRTHDYFATTKLRVKNGAGIILHLGAKVRATQVTIDDPHQLLTWHGDNRASFDVHSMDELQEHAPALRAILAAWLRYV